MFQRNIPVGDGDRVLAGRHADDGSILLDDARCAEPELKPSARPRRQIPWDTPADGIHTLAASTINLTGYRFCCGLARAIQLIYGYLVGLTATAKQLISRR